MSKPHRFFLFFHVLNTFTKVSNFGKDDPDKKLYIFCNLLQHVAYNYQLTTKEGVI